MEIHLELGAESHKTQARCEELRDCKIRSQRSLSGEYHFVYALQSKFQSIPLCAVDAGSPSLLSSSLLYEEGGYESKTDFAGDIIGRGGCPAGTAPMHCAIACAINKVGTGNGRSKERWQWWSEHFYE